MPATSLVPGLSQIQLWDTTHLTEAATHWTSTAALWEDSVTQAVALVSRPGGTPWVGEAFENAQYRAYSDRLKVIVLVDELHTAAAVARSGASELQAAKQRVLSAISDARGAGYSVGEDLSVTYPRTVGSAVLAAAKQSQAEAFAADIRARAAALTGIDHRVAVKITSAAASVAKPIFADAPPTEPKPADPDRSATALSVTNADDVHKIVDPLPPGKSPGVKTLPTPEAIRDLYGRLTENSMPGPPSTYRGEWCVLEDGTKIGLRQASGWGGPTVEIWYPDGTKVDVHLPERPKGPVPEPVPVPVPVPLPTSELIPEVPPLTSPATPSPGAPPLITPEEGGVLTTIAGIGVGIVAGAIEVGKWIFSPT